jgi:hypothetical protein
MHVQFDLGAAQEKELAAWHFIKHVSCELGERSRAAHLLRRASKATNILPPKHQSMRRTTYKEHRNIELAGKHFIKYPSCKQSNCKNGTRNKDGTQNGRRNKESD